MNSEKTNGVPRPVGGSPVHLAGELTRSCQIDGIPCLRQNLCSSHVLASPCLHFHSLSLNRLEEGGVPRPHKLRSSIHQRGDRISEPVPNSGSDTLDCLFDLVPFCGGSNLNEQVHVAVRAFLLPRNRTEKSGPLGSRESEFIRQIVQKLRPQTCLLREEARERREQDMGGVQPP